MLRDEFIFDLQRFIEIENVISNILINGTDNTDYIDNEGTKVTINAKAGSDEIWNMASFVTINGGDGNDNIENEEGKNVSISGGAGNDDISNYGGSNVKISGGDGSDYIENEEGKNVSISGGDGDDTIWSEGSSVTINGGAGNDDISNLGSYSSIDGGAGNDDIENDGSSVSINGGAGNDSIYNDGSNVTITGGKGDDYIVNNWDYRYNSPYNDNDGSNVLFKYSAGDGNDTIYGFKENSTLSIAGSSYSTQTSGKNLIVTVGNGKITLVGAADLKTLNIKLTKSSSSTSSNSWKVSGTTATYGTSSKTLVTLKGLKSGLKVSDGKISGISLSGTKITLSKAALSTSKVTVSSGYTLALGSDVTKPSTKKTWSYINSTATYKQTASAGYTLASDSKSISYTAATNKTLVTVKGVKSKDGLSVSGKVITVSKAALNASKVTVSDGYTLALASDVPAASTKKAWSYSNSVATYNQTTSAGYKLASDAKSISYTKKATSTLATVNGAKSKSGLSVSGKTIKLATSSLSNKVSVSGSYSFEFASDYKSAKITGSSSNDSITTAGQKITIASGAGNDYIVNKGKTSTINGGAGNDTIVNSGADVTIRGGKGNDSLTSGTGKDVFVYASGDGNDVITNYDTSDRISIESGTAKISTSNNDVIFTVGSGKITVKGGKGKTITYFDASGNELVYPEKSNAVKFNSNGTGATLQNTYEADKFTPSEYSNYENKIITINAAEVPHAISITGNKNANKITGTSEDDTIKGGESGDTILGGAGNDKLYGEKGNDSIFGGAGEDSLWGDEGSDTLTGGSGDDSLWGGAGNDTLYGGDGDDTFIYSSGDGKDTIADFKTGDMIIILDSNVGNPNVNASGDVIYKIDNGLGQLIIKNAKDKYIQPVDGKGNRLPVHNPT